MKFSIFLTQECNLQCSYCYIQKKAITMSTQTAEKAIDFVFNRAKSFKETINIGWFGGEPLLEFERLKEFTLLTKKHPSYSPDNVVFCLVSNGTIFDDEIGEFFKENGIIYGISCDGPAVVQNKFRKFRNGQGTSKSVERTILRANHLLGHIMVNAVYSPFTLRFLPETIRYFSELGVRQIYLTPDYSAFWDKKAITLLPKIYEEIGNLYIAYHKNDDPHYISLIDNKIAVILKNGYDQKDRCRMGIAEYAITPEGKVFPCERLVGNGNNNHKIGDIFNGIDPKFMLCHCANGQPINKDCLECGLKDYCMNWCGCSNYMTSGYYNRVSSFLCYSEKTILQTSFRIFKHLEKEMGSLFYEYIVGKALSESV